MKKISVIGILVIMVLCEFTEIVIAEDFNGHTIRLTVDSPSLGNVISGPYDATVGNNIEFNPSERVVPVDIDISDTTIFLDYSSTGAGRFASGTFNGYVFTDINNTISDIQDVSIDSTTTLNIDASRISFNENQVFINVSSLSFNENSKLKLNIIFSSSSLNDGLVAYYPFNGNANDESGNGNNGTINGASLTEDRFGLSNSAYRFDGVNDDITSDASVSSSKLTASAWILIEQYHCWGGIIDAFREKWEFVLDCEGSNKLEFTPWDSNSWEDYVDSQSLALDEWYHVVVVIDELVGTFYVNGMQSSSFSLGSTVSVEPASLIIGHSRSGTSQYFEGLIDDVRLYDRALSESEIQQLYNTTNVNTNTVYWTDWKNTASDSVSGSIELGTESVDVTFNGSYSFAQTSGGRNYWDPSKPYISTNVKNAPPDSDIIGLNTGGTATITFSRPVINPVIALTSWNGNTVNFGVPIRFLSEGRGYWGDGSPVINDDGTGFYGDGEVHGVIQLTGTYPSITFTHTRENWHGFTVGVISDTSNIDNSLDTDGDGIPDTWEIKYGLDPNNPYDSVKDSDNDGLVSLFEYYFGSSPNDEDSDDDGSSDFFEFMNQTDPLDSASIPLEDDDQDSMPNDWEIEHGLDPNDPTDSMADPDEDGLVNCIEFVIGSDPLSYTELKIDKNNKNSHLGDIQLYDALTIMKSFSETVFHTERNMFNELPNERISLNEDCKWVDENGNEWKKSSCIKSLAHQTDWIEALLKGCKNDKFTRSDGGSGSYEVIQDKYGNLIIDPEFIGTYNYYDCNNTLGCVAHAVIDLLPHVYNSNYTNFDNVDYSDFENANHFLRDTSNDPKYTDKPKDYGCECNTETAWFEVVCEIPEKASQAVGDPHLITFDGLAYDFQAAGEFVYIESKENPRNMTVQIRQQPWGNSRHVSVVTAVAMSVEGDTIELYPTRDTPLFINKFPTILSSEHMELPNGGNLYLNNNNYKIVWPDYSQISCRLRGDRLDIYANFPEARMNAIHGLFGNFDDNSLNDLTGRYENASIDLATVSLTKELLYGDFTESWRISQDESLFTYFSTDESTATYTDRNFPAGIITSKDLSEDQYNQAKTICQNAGVTGSVSLDSCILDIGLTGDEGFVQSFLDTNQSNKTEVVVLTNVEPDRTITANSNTETVIYGSSANNQITIESGAKAKLYNCPGNNIITIQADSALFTVFRSGAAVTFEGTDGTKLQIQATTSAQSIVFNDSFMLLVIDSGYVMLGNQVIDLVPNQIY